jgi:DNA polymerase-1
MELRLIAEFSKDPTWIRVFKEGKDLHSELCSQVFDIPLDRINDPFPPKPDISYRYLQKIIDFALAYGASHVRLAMLAQISNNRAKSIINKFFATVPKVKEFLTYLGNKGKERGYIKTSPPFGRIRWFPQWKSSFTNGNLTRDDMIALSEIERESMNTPIQGTNADILKLTLINTDLYIKANKYPANILLSVHDELVTQCIANKAEEWKNILEKIMIDSAKEVIKNIPVVVDIKVSDYWSK